MKPPTPATLTEDEVGSLRAMIREEPSPDLIEFIGGAKNMIDQVAGGGNHLLPGVMCSLVLQFNLIQSLMAKESARPALPPPAAPTKR